MTKGETQALDRAYKMLVADHPHNDWHTAIGIVQHLLHTNRHRLNAKKSKQNLKISTTHTAPLQ